MPSLCVALAVWFRSAYRVEQDVEITDGGDGQGVMNSLAPTGFSLDHRRIIASVDQVRSLANQIWNYCAADDRHIEDARTVAGQRAQFCDSQGEDAGEHDRVKESDGENGPHRDVS